jgi:hypothetical protein
MHNSDIHLAITINAVLHVVPLILVPFISFKSVSGKHGADDEESAFAWSELFIGARLISELNMFSVLVLNVINYLVILNVMELFMPVCCSHIASNAWTDRSYATDHAQCNYSLGAR